MYFPLLRGRLGLLKKVVWPYYHREESHFFCTTGPSDSTGDGLSVKPNTPYSDGRGEAGCQWPVFGHSGGWQPISSAFSRHPDTLFSPRLPEKRGATVSFPFADGQFPPFSFLRYSNSRGKLEWQRQIWPNKWLCLAQWPYGQRENTKGRLGGCLFGLYWGRI